MKIEFVGPASLATDGGVMYLAKLDGKDVQCHFSYEALEDVDPDSVFGDACLLYTSPSPRDGLLSRMPSSA